MKNWLSIGEFSKATDLSVKALRHYEDIGILMPHTRSDSRYRFYLQEQVPEAQRILSFKSLGFSLEQIKVLLKETNRRSLQSLLEQRLLESKTDMSLLAQQVEKLESILTSIRAGKTLSQDERSQIMDNILEVSLENLKRKGVVDSFAQKRIRDEISLYKEDKKNFVQGFRKILDYVRSQNILLGPGRGNSAGSLVLYAEGYSPFNPMKFSLLPELFSETKYLWLDVDYSHSEEIGKMCDALTQKAGFEIIAFKCPFLDILKNLETKIGKVEFDSFSDYDPLVLEAAKNGTRGLWGLEWNPDFHAFRSMSPQDQEKHNWDNSVLESFFAQNSFEEPMDYIVMEALLAIESREAADNRKVFFNYPQIQDSTLLPELSYTKGLLIFLEDWLSLYIKHTGATFSKAREALKKLQENHPQYEQEYLSPVENAEVREILASRVHKVFSKAHTVTDWWHYKRTAILKSLWPHEYLQAIEDWEQNNGMTWLEFGYKTSKGDFYLKA